jgi:uncharacterized membrane protein YdjX (TVP38/TMEM64 family)
MTGADLRLCLGMNGSWVHDVVHWMQSIQAAGMMGWFLFIVLYALACLLFIPGSILTVSAGAIYGFWGGTLLVLLGNGLGSILCVLVTRYLLRERAQKFFDRNEKMKAMEEAVQKDGWKIVCLTRLSPVMPFSLINYALGLTKISLAKFFLATEAGAIPSTCIYVYLGTLIGNLTKIGPDLRQHRPLQWTIQGVGLVLTIAVTVYVTKVASRSVKRRLERQENQD